MLSVWSLTRQGFFSASRPLMAAINSIRLLVVSGSPPASSFSLSPMRSNTPQPPGPGFPRQAPSVKSSTSGSSVRNELAWKLEDHALGRVVGDFLGDMEARPERIDDLAHQDLRSRGAGRDSDSFRLAEPSPVDVAGAFYQPCARAESLGDFGEPQRVAAVGRSDHQHPVAFARDRLHRSLPIGRCVANVLTARRADRRKARLERFGDRRRVVDRKRRLREESEVFPVGYPDLSNIRNSLNEGDRTVRNLSESADYLGMPGVADEQDVPAFLYQPLSLAMDLGYEWAGGVDIGEPARLRGGGHRLRNAMRRKDYRPIVGNFVELVDEHRTEISQPVNHEAVVDDFVAYVDRRTEAFERKLNDLDRPVDAGAEAPRGRDQHSKRGK